MALTEKQREKVQVCVKHRLVMWKEWEMKKWQREQMPRKWMGKRCEEDRNYDEGWHKRRPRQNGRRMETKSNRKKELKTAEHSERKVKGRKDN